MDSKLKVQSSENAKLTEPGVELRPSANVSGNYTVKTQKNLSLY